jgi:hypothetical protein
MCSNVTRFGRGSTFVTVTAGLALVCAALVACKSRGVAEAQAAPTGQPTIATIDPLQGLVPSPPFDETPITTFEAVGASAQD